MIDQLPTAVPQAVQSANNASRDRQKSAGDKDDATDSFEDIVAKAGKQQSRQDDDGNDKVGAASRDEGDAGRNVQARPKAIFELSAALRGLAQGETPADGRIQRRNDGQQALLAAKTTSKDILKAEQAGQQVGKALTNLKEKAQDALKELEKAAERRQDAAADGSVDVQEPLTPSDELSLLLGLSKESAKHDRKSIEADKANAKEKDDDQDIGVVGGDKLDIGPTLSSGDKLIIPAEAKASDRAPAADNAAKGDVVRLVSANGRGRSVDIDVPPVPGTQQQDGSKTSNTPKIDTATVIEARRYLGFAPEPNATALTTAIKADPTWTGALQAAQTSDLSTLGNTVTEVNTLKLQMNPENLGNMVASLKLKGEELTVELRVDSVGAYQRLSADHDDIVKGLQDQGFSIDKVTVQLNATDRTDTSASRDMARQNPRDGQTEQRQEQGGQSDRDNRREDNQSRWASGDHRDNTSGDGRTEPGRPGNIYL